MKSLFSESFTHKKWSIVILSFIVLLTSAGFITYETTKKNVTLNLDGRETVLKTHTTTVQQLLEDLDITLKPQDHVAPKKDTPISNDMKIVWRPAKQVQITQEDCRANRLDHCTNSGGIFERTKHIFKRT